MGLGIVLNVIIICFHFICVQNEGLSPIYANHLFSRQFFTYFNESVISIECKSVSEYMCKHANEDWALRLIDASGVVASGLVKGNYQFMGDFDECLDISVKLDVDQGLSRFTGQYCTLDIPLQSVLGKQNDSNSLLDIESLHLNPTLGVCLPNACTQSDLTNILAKYSSNTGLNVTVVNCTESKINPIKWIIFIAIFILILIGTLSECTNIFIKTRLPQKVNQTFESFSLNKNTIKLFSTGSEKGTIGCFHGFRLISLLFIILYHVFTAGQVPSANLLDILKKEKNFMLQIVTNAGLWVEAFFLMSGFLCSYGVIRELRQTSIKNYKPVSNLMHRYLRLTPSLLGILAFSLIQELMASGPQWYQYINESAQTCHRNWWTNILYVNNIVGLNQLGDNPSECLSFTWYLAVDMQLFLISPILIILLASNDLKLQYIGIAVNVMIIIISCSISAIITVRNGLTPTVLMTVYDLEYINKIYKQSYCRVGPYCVGILMAYYYLRFKGKLVINAKLNTILWLLSIGLNLSITFLTYPWLLGDSYHNFGSVLYGATHRTLWALSWAYMLFACATGHGFIINTVLSWNALIPLSRLSFQAYLYHSVIISRFVYSARQPIYSSNLSMVMMFFQYTVLTFIVSYIAFLMFEIPVTNIERLFFRKASRRPQPVLTSDDNNRMSNNCPINDNNGHTSYGSNTSQR